ncbi:MurR/RpiR family transcriptional regulator [Streptomyces sp. NPDC003314]
MSPTLADEIRSRLGDLSPAERKVARVLLAGYPAAVFETVATIAERASVSAPTVLRCASRLGYKGFPDLQAALRAELDVRTASPITLYETGGSSQREASGDPDGADPHRLGERLALVRQAVSQTFKELAPHEFEDAVDLLSDPRRRVHVAGGPVHAPARPVSGAAPDAVPRPGGLPAGRGRGTGLLPRAVGPP